MANSLTTAGAVILVISVVLFGLIVMSKRKSKPIVIFGLLLIVLFVISIVMLVYGLKPSENSSSTPPDTPSGTPANIFVPGKVGPAFNTIAGPISITNVSTVASSPGVLISFSSSGDCQVCQAVFDLKMTYSDKTTDTKEVSTSVTSGAVYTDYSPRMRPLPPGPVQISVTGFSTNPSVSGSQGPISAPYTLTTS